MGNTKKALVPKLRFKGFDRDWKKQSLSHHSSKISDGLHSTPNYEENGEYYFVNGNNLINGQIYFAENTKKVSENEYLKHKKDLSDRSILMSINGTIGSLALYNNEKVVLGKSACYININIGTNKFFIYYSLQNPRIKNFFLIELTGSTIKNLSLTTIKNCEIGTPTLPEQQKIASFLSAVDDKIRQLTRKKELLEQYKKGVMQQLFSGQLRFKDDKGKAFPEWEEKRLGDVCECLDNLRKPLNDSQRQAMKGTIPYWGANKIMDYVNDYLFEETLVLLAEDGGNFNEYETRPIANLSRGKCWVNNHTHVLKGKKNLSNEFLFYSLVHKNITGFVSGGTRAKLNKSEMLKIPIVFPTLSEQQKIATYLSAIDSKLERVSGQIEQTQTFKKGLLQQMFV